MPAATPKPDLGHPETSGRASERWPTLKVPVPPEWKLALEDVAKRNGQSVAGLVRLCIGKLVRERKLP